MLSFLDEIKKAHAILSNIIEPTPLLRNQYLCDLFQAEIWLKREDLTPVRSYKVRGAYVFLTSVIAKSPNQNLFVCASAGNHAQGFAYACKAYKKYGVVFMPLTTPQQKIMKTRTFGAPFVDIVFYGDGFDEANKAALAYAQEHEGMMVPPFDHPLIIQGQATVGKEILEQIPSGLSIDRVILPVGGGGLASGVTKYLESCCYRGSFTFVEPDGAPSLYAALSSGDRIVLDKVDNFVDGASVAQIGDNNFSQLQKYLAADVIRAPTDGVCATMMDMLNIEGIVLEPAGALAIDALQRLPPDYVKGKTIVCVTSGGNFDFERLPEVKERALKHSGLKKYCVIQLPQRPGALKDFLSILGPDDDITRFEYLKKSARNFGSILLGIETKDPENFKILFQRFGALGVRWEDITDDDLVASLVI